MGKNKKKQSSKPVEKNETPQKKGKAIGDDLMKISSSDFMSGLNPNAKPFSMSRPEPVEIQQMVADNKVELGGSDKKLSDTCKFQGSSKSDKHAEPESSRTARSNEESPDKFQHSTKSSKVGKEKPEIYESQKSRSVSSKTNDYRRISDAGRNNSSREKSSSRSNDSGTHSWRDRSDQSKSTNNSREENRKDKFRSEEKSRTSNRYSKPDRESNTSEVFQPNFYEFKNAERQARRTRVEYRIVREIIGDLFEMDSSYALAHCVAEDMNMGSGIAVLFRREYGNVGALLAQHQTAGGLAILHVQCKGKSNNREDNVDPNGEMRFLYYLVTKRYSYGKPTYETLFNSLVRMREHVIANNVRKVAMPRIGCGLDRLEWDTVKYMVEYVFRDVDVEIVVCNLEPDKPTGPQKAIPSSRIYHETYPIEQIEGGTIIIFYCSVQDPNFVSEEMRRLDQKFHFLNNFRSTSTRSKVYTFRTKDDAYVLCGCRVLGGNNNNEIDFMLLEQCVADINKDNRKLRYPYVGVQAVNDSNECTNQKIMNVLKFGLSKVDIYMCWPGGLAAKIPNQSNPRANQSANWTNDEGSMKRKSVADAHNPRVKRYRKSCKF